MLSGGVLAELGEETVRKLDEVLPPTWSRANPVDIIGDADSRRYASSLEILLDDTNVDCVLVLHAPTAVVSSDAAAEGVVQVAAARGNTKTLIASWLGGATVVGARRKLSEAGIPNYDTPDEAVTAFLHIIQYGRNQALLMETPASVPESVEPVVDSARLVIDAALADGREILSEPEAKSVLAAYGTFSVSAAGRVVQQVDWPERGQPYFYRRSATPPRPSDCKSGQLRSHP